MLSPQLGATSILLLSPDHTGTAVPLLVIWLLIDRAKPRWYVPVLVGLLFTVTMVGDSIILLTGIVPLVLVGAGRAPAGLIRRGKRDASTWYELSLAGAAAVAGVAGSFGPRAMAALGGYRQSPVVADTDLSQLQHGSWVTFHGFLELFGANVFNPGFFGARPALEVVFVAIHLAGAILAVWALGVGLVRIFRPWRADRAGFRGGHRGEPGRLHDQHARAGPARRARDGGGAAARRGAGGPPPRRPDSGLDPGGEALVRPGALRADGRLPGRARIRCRPGPSAPAGNEPLAGWLAAHGLTHGLASYWQANSTTVASSGHVVVSAVVPDVSGHLVPYLWESDLASYDPARHFANFVVSGRPFCHGRVCSCPRSSRSATRRGPTTSTASRSWSGTRTCWPSWTSRPELALPLAPPDRLCHMYRMRRLATTASAGSTQAAIMPR